MKVRDHIAAMVLVSATLPVTQLIYAQSAPLPVQADLSSVAASSSSSSSSSGSQFLFAPAASAAAQGAKSTASTGNSRPFSSLGIGVKLGTRGIGFDAATPLLPGTLNLRGGAGFFTYNNSFTESSDTINGSLKLNNAEIMADWFPFHGSFRLSAGLTVYNNTAVNGTLTFPAGSSFTVGNSKYYSDPASPTTGVAALKFGNNTVPRFTFGWGNLVPKTGHLRFETELGIDYVGDPSVLWTLTGLACTTTSTSSGTQCNGSGGTSTVWGPVASSDIAQENTNIQNDINGFKIFPVIQIGLSYKIH